jgi:type IV secretory pathway component VirB8
MRGAAMQGEQEVSMNLRKFLSRDKRLEQQDEPSPPNSERHGLWRILTVSVILATIAMIVIGLLV